MNNMNINSAIADTLDIGNTDTEKKTGLIGFYNYTVVLTYIGMWIGFLGVMLAIKDRYVGSLICLMRPVSVICLTAPLHPQRRTVPGTSEHLAYR